MATVKELESKVAALEAALEGLHVHLEVALQALAERVNEAHSRIDHAAMLFKEIARPLATKREPLPRVPLHEFNAALAELRGNNPHSMEMFAREVIVAKAMERRAAQQPA
jgi:hypothetical protein